MKSVFLCLDLLLVAAEKLVEWQRRYAEALAASKADAETIAAAKKAYEAAQNEVAQQSGAIAELKTALEAAQADDNAVAELDKRAAEILEKVGGVIRGDGESSKVEA